MIKAAAYYRMSTDRQEKSIEQQREAVERYAKQNGYRIVKDYADEGVSGWKSTTRLGFKQLIDDAQRGDFQAVLCWDQDRFSRFSPLEANHYWFLLDQAGVHLATVNQGRLDVQSLAGWLSASVTQHGKQQYCRDLSANVVRALLQKKQRGEWFGRVPYGYRLEGTQLAFGDPLEVSTVQRIFRARAAGETLSAICKSLNLDGISTPKGKLWATAHLRIVLDRIAYRGHTVIGERPSGRFNHICDSMEVVENTHPPIIPQELWDKAHAVGKLVRRSNGVRKSGAICSGLLYCKRCGSKLYKNTAPGNKAAGNEHKRANEYYLCYGYHAKRFTGEKKCGYCLVRRDDLDRMVVRAIRNKVLCGDRAKLRTALAKALGKRTKSENVVDSTRSQLATLEQQIATATERMLLVPQEQFAAAQKVVAKLTKQRQELAAKLETKPVEQKLPTVDQCVEFLWSLPEQLENAPAAEARELLGRMVDRIELDFELDERNSTPKKQRFRMSGGEIYLTTRKDESADPLSLIFSRLATGPIRLCG